MTTRERLGNVALRYCQLLLLAGLFARTGSPLSAAPPQPQGLLALATKVADVKKDWDQGHGMVPWDRDGNSYRWITNGQVLVFRFKGQARTHGISNDVWQLSRRDLRTRRETPLTVLSAIFNENSAPLGSTWPSPNGKWLLCPGFGGYCVAALDGSRIVKWRLGRPWEDGHWLGDSHRWVGLTDDEKKHNLTRATVYDALAPHRRRTVPVVRVGAFQIHADAPFSAPELGWDGRLRVFSLIWGGASTQSQVVEAGLGAKTAIRTFTVAAPPGLAFPGTLSVAPLGTALSPWGDRIAWVCERAVKSGMDRPRFSLWTSHVDGSQMREVGEITGETDSYHDILQWLPDNHHLSFVYKDGLYTVPVP